MTNDVARKRGLACKDKHGPDYYKEIGKKGGERTAETHGAAHYAKIGRAGGSRVARLIAAGKQLEEEHFDA